jgi:RHS repeat-associated protein
MIVREQDTITGTTETAFTYDLWGRKTSVIVDGIVTEFTYNPDGLRRSKTTAGVTTTHIWDGNGSNARGIAQIVLDIAAKYIPTIVIEEIEVNIPEPVGGVLRPETVTGEGFSGTIAWSPSTGTTFTVGRHYTANFTLTANEGYVFDTSKDIPATINGMPATVMSNNGSTAVLRVRFDNIPHPPTTMTSVAVEIAPPVTGEIRPAGILNSDLRFTATVAWAPSTGDTFGPGRNYTVNITLTAVGDYTFVSSGFSATINGVNATIMSNTGTVAVVRHRFTVATGPMSMSSPDHSNSVDGIQTPPLDTRVETVVKYIRGLTLIAAVSDSCTVFYLHNVRGDVVKLVNEAGVTVQTYRYNAFGAQQNLARGEERFYVCPLCDYICEHLIAIAEMFGISLSAGFAGDTDTNPFRFAGEYFDIETGMVYLRARHYDPRLGRFTQEDPFWGPHNSIFGANPQDPLGLGRYVPNIHAILQSSNLYAYVMNNPIRFIDPSGLNAVLAQSTIRNLSGGLPWMIGAFSTFSIAAKTSMSTFWVPIVGKVAIATTAAALGVLTVQTARFAIDAARAISWVNDIIRDGGNKEPQSGHTVYVIFNTSTSRVWYVGITNDFERRKNEHQTIRRNQRFFYDPIIYTMMPVSTGNTQSQARALEQSLIMAFTIGALNNKVNAIALARFAEFADEFNRVQSLLSP